MRIFAKQLLIFLTTLVLSFLLLALVLTQGIRNFLTEQKIDELTTLAARVAITVENFSVFGLMNIHVLQTELVNIYQYTDAIVIIVDNNFDMVLMDVPEFSGWINLPELMPLLDGRTVSFFVQHYDSQPYLVVGHPFGFNDEIAGAALVGFSMEQLDAAISEMYRITTIALLGTGLFALVLIYVSSQAISRPLQQMSKAATEIAGGDLEKRLPFKSRDEVGQLAVQFNRMAESLQQQERLRREFIANISHDIRSPLTSIRGYITAFQDGTIEPANQQQYLGIILAESERLIKLSNNIIDINRIQDADAELIKTEFDINSIIREIILNFRARATDKQIIIQSRFAHSSDIVLADEEKIRRIIYNLIDNAIKFTDENGEIIIETTVDNTSDKVLVSVLDNGCGMTEEECKRAFDRFYKGDASRNEDKSGSGLGLSIVQAFVRAHGETITLKSEPGVGSKFVFSVSCR